MEVSPGKLMIFGLALGFVSLIGFVQMRHAPIDSINPSTANASTGIADISDAGDGELLPEDISSSLPFGEVQHVTVNALILDSVEENETYVAPSGEFFTVGTEMLPGESYDIFLSLNNSAEGRQAVDLVVDLPDELELEVDLPKSSSGAVEINQQSPNRWTLVVNPSHQRRGGYFDLVITAYASKLLDFEDSMATFKLKTPYYLPEAAHTVNMVY